MNVMNIMSIMNLMNMSSIIHTHSQPCKPLSPQSIETWNLFRRLETSMCRTIRYVRLALLTARAIKQDQSSSAMTMTVGVSEITQ